MKSNTAYLLKMKVTRKINIQSEFLIDNIYVEFGVNFYQQIVDIPMDTDLLLYLYEADFVQHLQTSRFKKPKTSFNLNFRNMDDVLSLNNTKFNDYIDVIYPNELEIKDTTDAPKRAIYLDRHLEFDEDGKLFTQLHDKRDDLSSNIPESPAYGVLSHS